MTSGMAYFVRVQISCCLSTPADFTAPLRRSVLFRQSRNALFEGLVSLRVLSPMDGCKILHAYSCIHACGLLPSACASYRTVVRTLTVKFTQDHAEVKYHTHYAYTDAYACLLRISCAVPPHVC